MAATPSSPPNRWTVVATGASMAMASVTSAGMANKRAGSNAAVACRHRSPSWAQVATTAPSAGKAHTQASPIPETASGNDDRSAGQAQVRAGPWQQGPTGELWYCNGSSTGPHLSPSPGSSTERALARAEMLSPAPRQRLGVTARGSRSPGRD